MDIKLTPDQIAKINEKQAQVEQLKRELSHAEEKRDLIVYSIATAKGALGDFTYSFDKDTLIITQGE